jgi:Asp-tRNA(Asn)/Glu-tRNA(Gln) amidotransferase A subunit family amidase
MVVDDMVVNYAFAHTCFLVFGSNTQNDRSGTGIVIPSTTGPMARTVDDCALFMKAACVPENWQGDLNAPPMPFDSEAFEKKGEKLVIGYFETDEWFAPSVASRRAVQETIQHLTKAGHTCKPILLPTNGWFNYGL